MKRRHFITLGSAAAGAALCQLPVRADQIVVSGARAMQYADFDNLFVQFMVDNGIRAGQFAFGRDGHVLFSHAYGTPSLPIAVHTTSVLRVASVSKAFTAAGIAALSKQGKFEMDTPLFPYIGVQSTLLPSQRPDAHINAITIGQAAAHTSGLAPSGEGDPEFEYRKIENSISASGPLTQRQFAQYIYGRPLNAIPGRTYAYSNIGYFLLGRVIEKAASMAYLDYLQKSILDPLSIGDVSLSPTDASKRLANETIYDDTNPPGLSVLNPQSQQRLPLPYGGATYWETFDACSDLATSASSLVTFIGTHAAWGVGPRASGSARAGAMPGTESVIYNRRDGIDYAFIFNKRVESDPFDTEFRRNIDARLDKGI